MKDFKSKFRVAAPVVLSIWIILAALYGLLKPISNRCIMTYMYPTYIPMPSQENVSSARYGLFLYHEGWWKVDFSEHLKKLSGVPVLFIPGNGGSYKQVRSLAAESDRAYQRGPFRPTFYQEASRTPDEGGINKNMAEFSLPNQYSWRLDWFTVDLKGERSAMDGQILEEHTEYVVYAVHRILDQYKESHDARVKEGSAGSGNLPKSVILVGHSIGGFVARAVTIHPHLRKSAVETILTLSCPHQFPPVALQPSLGHYYSQINREWRKGYEVQISRTGQYVSGPILSDVVVVSISGGANDYQVRSNVKSLDGIVPPTHGFMISGTGMKNVWLSMEHQAILWCNQLVVQVSHTLLSLIDSKTGQPFSDPQKRLAIFTRMLHSGISHIFNSLRQSQPARQSMHLPTRDRSNIAEVPLMEQVIVMVSPTRDRSDIAGSQLRTLSACPSSVHWSNDGLERDLYIETTTVTVLAMDGRRRWLDIHKLGSNGKNHFIFVTNLAPCSGVRLHLWPEKRLSASGVSFHERVVEVTSKMVEIPSGPAPIQIEPGSQTEQAPPSAVFWLGPEDMHGFRFLTISVAPRPTVSGRPPPAVSMGVGQFFNPEEGERKFAPQMSLLMTYSQKDMILKEDHPLAFNLSFTITLGLLPVKLSLMTTGCGIKRSGLPLEDDDDDDQENSKLCKLRCFPPVALAWDPTSGLHIFPNLYSETIVVDSSPVFWGSTQRSEKTTVLLLVDPHCSYKASLSVSITAAASRFVLLHSSQILGFSFAVIFFALMRQAHAWEFDQPLPSMLSAVESNLRMPLPFLFLAVFPIFISLFISFIMSQSFPPFVSFFMMSMACYLFANGSIIILILISQLVFYVAAITHAFIKTRWEAWEGNFCFSFINWFLKIFSGFISIRVVRVLKANPFLVTALTAITLACFLQPALGLLVLLLSHALCCHNALSGFLTASFRSHARSNHLTDSIKKGSNGPQQIASIDGGGSNHYVPLDENCSSSPESARSFGDTQLEIFHHRHGLLILHLLAAVVFVPSLVAWFQRMGMGRSLPWLLDSALCTGVILHGICDSKPEFNFFLFPFPGIPGREVRLSLVHMLAGYYSYLSGVALAPYRAFYAMATIGVVSFAFRIIQRRNREKGEARFCRRKHAHRY